MPTGIYTRPSSKYAQGTIHSTPTGTVEVLKEVSTKPRTLIVRFLESGYITECRAANLVAGKVKDHRKPSVYGVGYLDGIRIDARNIGNRPLYDLWANMLKRCYGGYDDSYVGCTVDKRWHSFRVFANSIQDVAGYERFCNGDDVHLDKDILVPGSTVYSLATCQFVSAFDNVQESAIRRWAKA